MTRVTLSVGLLSVLGCSPQSVGPSQSDGHQAAGSGIANCERKTDAGFTICCGRSSEIPGLSCVDLSVDGGEFGVYRKCIESGASFDAKVEGAQCCDGLVRVENHYPADAGPLVDATGCFIGSPPSTKTCLPCGNEVCDEAENRCNCPADCVK
jgi:hypothetical protein